MIAKGTFEVELNQSTTTLKDLNGVNYSCLSLNKTFQGDIEGTSFGEMISARTRIKGSAGYVAIEHFSGSIGGVDGTVAFQHFGTMEEGNLRLILEPIPGSGTDGFEFLKGSMSIEVKDGVHYYEFNYSLNLS